MNSVDTRTDAPEAPCPTCALSGEGKAREDGWGITTAHYLCPAGHGWVTKWYVVREGGAA